MGVVSMSSLIVSARIVGRVCNRNIVVGYRCLNELTGVVFNVTHENLILSLKDGETTGKYRLSNGERTKDRYFLYDCFVRHLPTLDAFTAEVVENDLCIVLAGVKVDKKFLGFLVTDATGVLMPVSVENAYDIYHSRGLLNMKFKGRTPSTWGKIPLLDYDSFARGQYSVKDAWRTTIAQKAVLRIGNKG
jgi:hypothetical protein